MMYDTCMHVDIFEETRYMIVVSKEEVSYDFFVLHRE